MSKAYEFDFVGYAPEFGTTAAVYADTLDHAENKAKQYVTDTFPELQDVEITAGRELN